MSLCTSNKLTWHDFQIILTLILHIYSRLPACQFLVGLSTETTDFCDLSLESQGRESPDGINPWSQNWMNEMMNER